MVDAGVDPALSAMLEARSVAIVGASPRPGTPGNEMVVQLVLGGFAGEAAAVNPKYGEVGPLACYPSLADVPFVPELVLLGVGNHALEEQMWAAAERGARGVVVFAGAAEEPPRDPPLAERVAGIARDAGMAVCGANCMGFVNLERNLRALAFEERPDLAPGGVAFVSHSGSAFSAMLHARRGIRFNIAVSAGQELTHSVADYMHYALGLASTRAIALFLETARDPEGFVAALELAASRDVPVVALKVGRTSSSGRLVNAHSGALAGDAAAFEAVFEAYGVSRVATLGEMADLLELMGPGRWAAPGGLAAVHDSGGERAHLVDVADEVGTPLARPSGKTLRLISDRLDPGLPAVNPLDAWGTGYDADNVFLDCSRFLLEDPDTGAFAFAVDLTGEDTERQYPKLAERIFASTDKPFAVVCGLASAIDQPTADYLRASGIPVLEDVASALRAFRHLFERRDGRDRRGPQQPEPAPVRERWRARLDTGGRLAEAEALRMLSDYGIPVARATHVASLSEALVAADRTGYPVALKTAVAAHKTEVGGVMLGLSDGEALARAYRGMSARLGPEATVQEMVEPGVEVALGVVRDPQFGPLVVVAAGGLLIETLRDRRLALPPLDEERALGLIDRLEMRPLLDGVRGSPAADVRALARATSRLSVLALDLGDHIDALDVNPLISGPRGCVAVDALVEPRATRTDASWTRERVR